MSFSPKTRGRCWVVTIHIANMINAGLTKEQYENPEYVATYFKSRWENSGKGRTAGVVVCLSVDGCYHMHMACYSNTTTLKNVSDVLFAAHVEPQLGGKEELKSYLLKNGKNAEKNEQVLFEVGIESIQDNQGKRNDLDEIEQMLDDGATPEEIYETSFRYRKYERMIKSAFLSKRIKETPRVKDMWNAYHWGASGTGKTYSYIKLCEKVGDENVYLCNDYANTGSSGGGFDFYSNNPAKIIVLDEFRGQMKYNQLLSLLDVYSRNQQHCRFQNTYNLWNSVIICSIYPIEDVYRMMVDDTNQSTDSMRQLLRRINVIVYHYKNKNGKYREYVMSASDYLSAEDMMRRASEYEKYADDIQDDYSEDEDIDLVSYCSELFGCTERSDKDEKGSTNLGKGKFDA